MQWQNHPPESKPHLRFRLKENKRRNTPAESILNLVWKEKKSIFLHLLVLLRVKFFSFPVLLFSWFGYFYITFTYISVCHVHSIRMCIKASWTFIVAEISIIKRWRELFCLTSSSCNTSNQLIHAGKIIASLPDVSVDWRRQVKAYISSSI